jgi:hypothetical protein
VVPGAYSSEPSFPDLKSFYGMKYKVTRSAPGEMTFGDEKGHSGAKAISSLTESVFVVPSVQDTFKMKFSVDEGVTWTNKSINLTSDMTIPLPLYWSLTEIATKLYDSLYSNFIVSVEDVYTWPEFSDTVTSTLDVAWPLNITDVDHLSGKRSSIVIRARASGTWMKFDAPGNLDLGFSTSIVYKGASRLSYCSTVAQDEIDARNVEIPKLNTLLAVADKIDRGLAANVEPLKTPATTVLSSVSSHIANIQEALAGATGLMAEVDATASVALSFTGAQQAVSKYTQYLSESNGDKTKDTAYKNSVQGTTGASYASDFHVETISRTATNNLLSSQYASTGEAVLNLTASLRSATMEPRIVFGDRTKNPTVPLGISRALVSVFPEYLINGSMMGTYILNPFGSWVNTSVTSRYSSGVTEPIRMDNAFTISSSITGVTLESTEFGITLTHGTDTFYTAYDSYPTLTSLIAKIDADGLVTCTLGSYPGNTAYGTLVMMPLRTLTVGTPQVMPFGIKGDISFYVVSDYNLVTRRNQDSSRVSTVGGYKSWYTSRKTQLKQYFGTQGESLPTNRQYWLAKLLQRVYGPVCTFLPLKRVLKEHYNG